MGGVEILLTNRENCNSMNQNYNYSKGVNHEKAWIVSNNGSAVLLECRNGANTE